MTPAMQVSARDPWSRVRQTLPDSILLGAAATVAGLVLHVLAVAMRDFGPAWGGVSLRDNGAAIVLPLALVVVVAGEMVCVRDRAWLGMVLVPLGLFAGLFVILGGI
jgi:hypothetical protein